MRISAALLVFAAAVVARAADPAPVTLESRSQHYSLIVEVQPQDQYDVKVTDLQTNETLLIQHLAGSPSHSVEASGDLRDLHITVRVGPAPYGVTATAEIEQGEMLVDSIHAVWTLQPHRAHLRVPGVMRVGGEVKAPLVIHRVNPMYSEEARRERISGIAIIEVLIDKSGLVKDAVVVKELPAGLSDAALDAVRQWTFQPATLHGEPVDVIFNLTVNFKLDMPPVAKNPT